MPSEHATPPRGDDVDRSVFPLHDLYFAIGWARLAPGYGGWHAAISNIASGEMLDITPPGADHPVFHVLPRDGHVELVRERPAESGGGQTVIGRCPTLRDAVLLLCPLHPASIASISDEAPWPL